MTYGTGEILGVAAHDALELGSSWMVRNQSFIIVEDAELPVHLSWDGICGLAWRRLAVAGEPVYQRFQEQGRKALFSLVPSTLHSGPQMVLGEVPLLAMQPGTLAWAKAEPLEAVDADAKHSFWVTSGGVGLGVSQPTPARFLVDTGTNQVLLVPPNHFALFMRALLPMDLIYEHCGVDTNAGGLFICDCSVATAGLPPLRVHLGDHIFEIPAPEMFRQVTAKDGGRDLCLLEVQPNRMATQGVGTDVKDLLAGLLKPEIPQKGEQMLDSQLPGCCSWDSHRCGSTTDFCNANRNNCETQCTGKWLPTDAAPFPLPKGATEVREVTEARPGGSVCKTWKVFGHGSMLHHETRCAPSSRFSRRLQALPRIQTEERLLPLPMVAMHRHMESLWVLGGVFLQRFVTVFDFDQGRMGFAHPAEPVAPHLALAQTGLDALPGPRAAASLAVAQSVGSNAVDAAGAQGACGSWRQLRLLAPAVAAAIGGMLFGLRCCFRPPTCGVRAVQVVWEQ